MGHCDHYKPKKHCKPKCKPKKHCKPKCKPIFNGTLLELAVATPSLSILVQAVQAADPAVAATLNNPELSLTLFAPDNRAFEKLLAKTGLTLEELVADQQKLTEILLYHVLSLATGEVLSKDIPQGGLQNVPTLLPEKTVNIDKRCKKIDVVDTQGGKARVLGKDNLASNGVAHIISEVLLPFAL